MIADIADREVAEAARALEGVAVRTPLQWVEPLDAWLKLESRQPMGAFKIRGAYNAIRKLSEAARARGVITFSSGNHGQAVAYAAQRFGVRAVIVMPETAPAVKVDGVKRWGGEVVFAGRTSEDRRVAALEIAARDGLAVIPPFDHPDIIAGQATVGVEIVEDLPDVATVVVPVGGGGLISGVARGLAAAGSRARIVGVEPAGAPKLSRSLAAGRPVTLERTASIADGLITLSVGELPFEVLQQHKDRLAGVVTVTDDAISEAVFFLHQNCGLAVEPSGAATTAALRAGLLEQYRRPPVVAGRERWQRRSGAARGPAPRMSDVPAVAPGRSSGAAAVPKILVADDDESLVRTLSYILKEKGYDVVVSPGGENLISLVAEEKPQLLLLDIMMPKVDGLQLLERI